MSLSFIPKVKSIPEILNETPFSFSAEIVPPRNGTSLEQIFQTIEKLKKAGFHFISVTHGPGGSLRGGTLPISYYTQSHYKLTAIAHLTVRGATKEDLENTLIDHYYFGIRNILALRGDPPTGIGEKFTPTPRGFQYAWELVELASRLNQGKYFKRPYFDKTSKEFVEGIPTNFCIGVASYPEDPYPQNIEYLKIKKEKGAHFSITQMCLSFEDFSLFYKEVYNLWGVSFPILPGIRIPTKIEHLERMEKKFQIKVPPELWRRMYKAREQKEEATIEEGIKWCKELIERYIELGIRGVHFFLLGNPDPAIQIKKELGL